MKKRTFRILFLIFGIVLLLNIKPILQYVNHAIMQAISAKMDAEEEDRARRAAEGHIIEGRDTFAIWNDTYAIMRYSTPSLYYRYTPYGQYADYVCLLGNVTDYKATKHKFYVRSDDGYAVIDENNICRLYSVPSDTADTESISDYDVIRYLSDFEEFSEEEQKQLNKLKTKADRQHERNAVR